mmetsp:Transcript_19387/g.55796  ORF Transcript_19387/g.55796 Transcript_19387/m.55796 type:complete len:274 (+) Transcript_19387:497-1318(+)
MPFHCSLKAFALANSANIYILSGDEVSGVDPRPRLRHGIGRRDTELPHNVRRLLPDVELIERRQGGPVDVLGLALSGTDDDGIVPIGPVRRLVADDDVAVQIQHRARVALPPPIPDGHHAHLDAQGAAALVPEGPCLLAAEFGLEVREPVRHLEGPLPLAGLPVRVLLGLGGLLHGGELGIQQGLDLLLGQVGIDGVDAALGVGQAGAGVLLHFLGRVGGSGGTVTATLRIVRSGSGRAIHAPGHADGRGRRNGNGVRGTNQQDGAGAGAGGG